MGVARAGDVSTGSLLWRLRGQLHATILVKARFRLTSGARATLAEPPLVRHRDVHRGSNPVRSIIAPSDLVPYRGMCDVWLIGHAYAPPGRPVGVLPARLAVYQDQTAILDKTIYVIGDRSSADGDPTPFQKMEIAFERAYGGVHSHDNPVGTGAVPGSVPPNLIASEPQKVACFAPLPALWRSQAFELTREQRAALGAAPLSLPDELNWHYFHAAPDDQRVPLLRGDEWIVLDGLHPALPRMQSQLPFVRGRARAWAQGASEEDPGYPVQVVADTLAIDTDEQTVTITWRGSFPLRSEDAIPTLRIAAGIAIEDREPDWAAALARYAEEQDDSTVVIPPVPPGEKPLTSTALISPEELQKALASLPFDIAKPSETPWLRPAPIPNAPWATEEAPPSVRSRALEAPPEAAEPQAASLTATLDDLAQALAADVSQTQPTPGSRIATNTLPFAATASARSAGEAPPPATGLPFEARRDAGPAPSPPEAPPSPRADARPPFAAPFASPGSPPPQAAPPPPPGSNRGLPFAPPLTPAEIPPAPRSDAGLPFTGATATPAPAPRPAPKPSDVGLPFSPPIAARPPEASEPVNVPSALPFQGAPAALEARPVAPALAVLPFQAATSAAALPEETRGDMVPPVTLTPLMVATLPWQVKPPQPSLTVIVKGTFDLIAGAEAELCEECDFPTGNVHLDDDLGRSIRYPSDFAILKPRCDVTVVGTAHQPKRSNAMEVGFRFGDRKNGFERRIAVWGDRRWGPVSATEPEKFETMPLIFERAYGGAGHTKNPYGIGAAPDASGVRGLPNLENPNALIGSATDDPEPACMAPVPAAWRHARAYVGTYDDEWQALRWPYFPKDFDFHFFQHAPREQQLDSIAGDERWQAWGMTPGGAIEGRLPGLRVRCFAKKLEALGGAMSEVNLRLDTCHFDFDTLKLHLVWRGIIDVSDVYASELAALFVTTEPMEAEPMALADAPAAYRAARLHLQRVDDDPAAEAVAANDLASDQSSALRRAEQQRTAALVNALPFGGAVTAPEPPGPHADEIRAHLASVGASDEQIEASVAAITAPPPEGQPKRVTREGVLSFLSAGGDITALDLTGADLTGIDLSLQNLAGAILVDAKLTGARLVDTNLAGAQLSGADLSDAVLDGADLEQADLQRALLSRASLVGARLEETDMTGIEGDDANFNESQGAGCIFAEASLARAQFQRATLEGADFTEASLSAANFEDAKLPEVRLYSAEGEGVCFARADLTDARADGAKLPRVDMKETLSEASVWTGAQLDGAAFTASKLAGASFERASCVRVVFGRCDLREGRFKEADLTKATFIQADLMKSDFESAKLSDADLRKANMHGCEVWKASLAGAKLDGAILTGTKLDKRS